MKKKQENYKRSNRRSKKRLIIVNVLRLYGGLAAAFHLFF